MLPRCYLHAACAVYNRYDASERKSASMASHRFLFIEPGARVRHPTCPEWGVGQVQSVVADRITVNFEDRGKVLINAQVVALELVDD